MNDEFDKALKDLRKAAALFMVFWFLLGVFVGGYFCHPAQADGGLIDSAHRMAVAQEEILNIMRQQKCK